MKNSDQSHHYEDKDIINADGIEEISTMLRRMERYWTDQIRYIY